MNEFIEDREELKSLEIDDQHISHQLQSLSQSTLQCNWILELLTDKRNVFAYSIDKKINDHQVVFHIDSYIGDKVV